MYKGRATTWRLGGAHVETDIAFLLDEEVFFQIFVGHGDQSAIMFILSNPAFWYGIQYISFRSSIRMDCEKEHQRWLSQVEKLKGSMGKLTDTDPKNLLQHFFLQVIQIEFSNELETHKSTIKTLICNAVTQCTQLSGTVRSRAAQIIKQTRHSELLQRIRLSDIRNKAVFEVYKSCGVTIDTYFQRYSSPPGTEVQNLVYNQIAHGSAQATARETVELSNILIWMQILKRLFRVYDSLTLDVELVPRTLNWVGAMWCDHIRERSLGDLVWELYLDLWSIEN